MKTIKTIWAAGIVDGEGSILLQYDKRRDKITCGFIDVTNTDLRILNELQQYFGGAIHKRDHLKRPTHKPCRAWTLRGRKVIVFLEAIYPYLISKREQADKVLKHYLGQ